MYKFKATLVQHTDVSTSIP